MSRFEINEIRELCTVSQSKFGAGSMSEPYPMNSDILWSNYVKQASAQLVEWIVEWMKVQRRLGRCEVSGGSKERRGYEEFCLMHID